MKAIGRIAVLILSFVEGPIYWQFDISEVRDVLVC